MSLLKNTPIPQPLLAISMASIPKMREGELSDP